MLISARNQLKGTISHISKGAVNGVVTLDLGSTLVKADITLEAIAELGLKEGMSAQAIIKASNVMFSNEPISGLSARNQLKGTISSVKTGAVNGHVTLETADGAHILGSITNEAIAEVGLQEGCGAVAIIKATDVIVGVE